MDNDRNRQLWRRRNAVLLGGLGSLSCSVVGGLALLLHHIRPERELLPLGIGLIVCSVPAILYTMAAGAASDES
jgi:hypothetical protein